MKNANAARSASPNQPWVIYDRFRDALLGQKYYGARLTRIHNLNTSAEIIIALGAATSTIGGLAIWQFNFGAFPIGATCWAILSGAATTLAVVKPLLHWSDTVKRYTRLCTAYTTIAARLRLIVEDIAANQGLNAETVAKFDKLVQEVPELAPLEDANPSKKLLVKFQAEINSQYPPDRFWRPRDAQAA